MLGKTLSESALIDGGLVVQCVVDKSSSSTSCLTDSLYQDVEDQEVGAWLKRVLTYHTIQLRVETQVLFGIITMYII